MATFSPQTMLNVYENCVSNGKNMEDCFFVYHTINLYTIQFQKIEETERRKGVFSQPG